MKRFFIFSVLVLSLAGCQREAIQPNVYGRFVPERKDDFAWENEYAAFRMYGPALRPENPSNGVDLWLKGSPELVVDSFYYREHVLGLPYHINYGKGLDCYKVGHTCGAGGLVVLADEKMYVGGAYDRWQILEQSPQRFVFRLEYDSLQVANTILRETITITAEAGKILNKAEVVLTGDYDGELLVGGGIYLHDTVDVCWQSADGQAIAYAENALSDKTAAKMNFDYNGSTSQGRSYLAVVVPGATERKTVDGSYVCIRPYHTGDTLSYYFGACWSEWSNGKSAFPTDEEWFNSIATQRY